MAAELTEPQFRVLRFLLQHDEERKAMPTHRELSARFHWASSAAAKCHLLALEKKGYIKRVPQRHRAIELTALAREHYSVPLGEVA